MQGLILSLAGRVRLYAARSHQMRVAMPNTCPSLAGSAPGRSTASQKPGGVRRPQSGARACSIRRRGHLRAGAPRQAARNRPANGQGQGQHSRCSDRPVRHGRQRLLRRVGVRCASVRAEYALVNQPGAGSLAALISTIRARYWIADPTVFRPDQAGLMARRGRCRDDRDAGRRDQKSKREPAAEERAAEEMGATGPGAGPVAAGPDVGLVLAEGMPRIRHAWVPAGATLGALPLRNRPR